MNQQVRQPLPLPVALAAAAVTPLVAGVAVAFPRAADVPEEALLAQVQRQGRKFSKVEALYTPGAVIPPIAWRYECRTCRFWQPAAAGQAYPTCRIVGLPDDPLGGEAIHPLHWCGFWLSSPSEPAFRWIAEWLDPGLAPSRGEL